MFKLHQLPQKKMLFFPKPARILFLVVLFVLTVLVTTTTAQEGTPAADDLPPEVTILEQIVTPNAVTTTYNIETTKDTFVSSNYPNTNYGSFGQLRTGYDTPPSSSTDYGAQRLLMEFNIGAIPPNAVIDSATFYIYQEGATGWDNLEIEARYLASSWDENSVTWNSHQPIWGNAIGRGTASLANGWKTVDATQAVREWYSGAQPNYGVVFQTDETPANGNQRIYRSRETNEKPYMIVTYTVYNDNCAPAANITPFNAWSPGTFTVSWSGTDCGSDGLPPSGIAHYDVQYSTDNANWHNWQMNTTATSAAFGGSNNTTYWFRVRAIDKAGNVGFYSTPQSTRVDSMPPTATITPLPQYTQSSSFQVSWSGFDTPSGIASYEVQFREAGGSWGTQYYPASQTSDWATGGEDRKTYEFRVRAIDQAGNYSAWSQTSTTVILTPFSTILPFSQSIVNDSSFQVSWVGYTPDAVNNPITQYDIRYRVDGGAWQDWLPSFSGTTTFATFNAATEIPGWDTGGTALIEFEVRAVAQGLAPESFTGEAEAGVVADPGGNMQVRAYMPVIFQSGQ